MILHLLYIRIPSKGLVDSYYPETEADNLYSLNYFHKKMNLHLLYIKMPSKGLKDSYNPETVTDSLYGLSHLHISRIALYYILEKESAIPYSHVSVGHIASIVLGDCREVSLTLGDDVRLSSQQ